FLTGGLNGLLAGFVEAGGADHAFHAMFDAGIQMLEGGFGPGEIDQAVGIGQGGQIGGDPHASLDAQKGAGILPDAGRVGTVEGNGQREIFAVQHGFNEHAAHAAICPRNCNTHSLDPCRWDYRRGSTGSPDEVGVCSVTGSRESAPVSVFWKGCRSGCSSPAQRTSWSPSNQTLKRRRSGSP